jgi:hypothetical protein
MLGSPHDLGHGANLDAVKNENNLRGLFGNGNRNSTIEWQAIVRLFSVSSQAVRTLWARSLSTKTLGSTILS